MKISNIVILILPLLFLSSCREKASDKVSSKREYPFVMPFKYGSDTDSLNRCDQEPVQDYGWGFTERYVERYIDYIADWYAEDPVFSTPERVAADWIPFELLKVKRLNSDQISKIYGQPIHRSSFIIPWKEYDDNWLDWDEFYILERIRNPNEVIHKFTWDVDSGRYLHLYCLERAEGVYTPVWGYQCNPGRVMME